jgi:LAO/AO transport system kinase
MENLARDERAFIRPSPSGGTLGGVARKTRETMVLFEAAGYDVLIVETVGVGQSEISVRGMVDFFLLVLIAGAGDELQGIKRGIIEIADGILINKADGENLPAAEEARANYERALQFLSPATEGWQTPVKSCSALHGKGIEEVWRMVREFTTQTRTNGVFEERRKRQSLEWLHKMVEERLRNAFYQDEKVRSMLGQVEEEVLNGRIPVTRAAWKLLDAWDVDSTELG